MSYIWKIYFLFNYLIVSTNEKITFFFLTCSLCSLVDLGEYISCFCYGTSGKGDRSTGRCFRTGARVSMYWM